MGKLFEGPGLIVLILVVLLLFGSKRLPDVARGVGRSLRIFKAETKGLMTDDEGQSVPAPAPQQIAVPPAPPVPPVPAVPPPPVQQPAVQQPAAPAAAAAEPTYTPPAEAEKTES